MSPDVERRRARRVAAHIPVRRANDPGRTVFAVTKDVSPAGLYFYTETDDWKEGKQIEFVIDLPAEVTAAGPATGICRGTIVRSETIESVVGVAVRIDRFSFLN
jgi:PilZ domain